MTTMSPMLPLLPRAALSRTMTVLLAGGQGSRLHELTARVCKPALPLFKSHKGVVRMIDFTMANALRSGLSRMIVATQYRPETLEAHLQQCWGPLFAPGDFAVRNGTALRGAGGYRGTGDAVAANSAQIAGAAPDEVLVLSGDHIYQMDYSAMIAAHRASGAAVTLAVSRVPLAQASDFGVVQVACDGAISSFAEKPANPTGDPRHPGEAMVSMGVYVFDWRWLRAQLPFGPSALDFGQHLLPVAVKAGVAFAYALPPMPGQAAPYWRDVGTLDSLRRTLLELQADARCAIPVLPGAPFLLAGMPDRAVMPPPRDVAGLSDSVLLPGAWVAPGAQLGNAIVAPGTFVPADLTVGQNARQDARWFRRSAEGTLLITNAMLANRAGRTLEDLRHTLSRAYEVPSIAC